MHSTIRVEWPTGVQRLSERRRHSLKAFHPALRVFALACRMSKCHFTFVDVGYQSCWRTSMRDIGRAVRKQRLAEKSGAHDLAELYRLEAPRLARFFRRRFRSEGEAQDWVHETFARFVQMGSSQGVGNPRAYLQRIAHNLWIDSWRKAVAKPEFVELEQAQLASPPNQEIATEADDLMRQYRQALNTLTPRTRVVFLLHRVEELTYKEIATRLEISINTVEYHMARALSHLDRALDRR